MALSEIRVPDIGDFKNVTVIEILVAPGQTVSPEQSLITVESDKASMEIPAPSAGTVHSLKIKLGDKVSQGTPILMLESASAGESLFDAPARPEAKTVNPTSAVTHKDEMHCQLLVLGGGPGGYSAAFRAADLGVRTIIVERHATLGGVCLNVGCIPSKALLHVALTLESAQELSVAGVSFAAPKINLEKLRAHKGAVLAKLTGGLAAMAKARKVTHLMGEGTLLDAHRLRLRMKDGGEQIIRFDYAILAAGSEAARLPFLPEDPRIVTSTGALALPLIPKRMLIIGGGIIGLEMGSVYSALGAKLDVVEMLDGLMPGADRDLVKVWQRSNAARFERVMLKTKTVAAQATPEGIRISFDGEGNPPPQTYDLVLQAAGRRPNGKKIGAEQAGIAVDERGFVSVNQQMRTNIAHCFAIGDLVGNPMLAHKAVHEAHVAAEVIAGEILGNEALARSAFEARVIPAVAYTHPEIAWAGLTEEAARAQGVAFDKGLFPWAASGRAIANGCEEGFTKLLFDKENGRIIGGGIVGVNAGDMIGEVALAIEMGARAEDIAQTIHPHPTLGETIGLAAEALLGHCTDLPPVRK